MLPACRRPVDLAASLRVQLLKLRVGRPSVSGDTGKHMRHPPLRLGTNSAKLHIHFWGLIFMDAHQLETVLQRELLFPVKVTRADNNQKILITPLHPDGRPACRPMGFSVLIMANEKQRKGVVEELTLQFEYKLGQHAQPNTYLA